MTSAKGAVATLCIRAISIAAQLGFFVLAARATSIDVVGIFAVASATWVLARALLPMGWNVAVLRSVSVLRAQGNLNGAGSIARSALMETAFLGCALATVVISAALLVIPQQALGVGLASVVAVLWAEIGVMVSYLRAMGDLMVSQTCDGVVVYVVPLLACGGMAIGGFAIDFSVIAVSFVLSAVVSLALLFLAAKRCGLPPNRWRRDRELIPEQRRLAWRLWWNQAFSALSGRMSVLMAAPVAGVAATAIVETGLRTQLVGATLAWAGGTVASPRYAVAHEKETGEGPRILNLVTWAAILPSTAVVLMLVLWGEAILSFLGPAYVSERWAVAVMALAAVVELPAASGGYFLMMTGRERVANSSTVLQLVVLVILIAVFGPMFGAAGIAYAVLLASAVRTVVVLVALRKDEVTSPIAGRGLLTLVSRLALYLRPRT